MAPTQMLEICMATLLCTMPLIMRIYQWQENCLHMVQILKQEARMDIHHFYSL
uniref:Alternative protein ANKRD62 n=1 Tax=Homo sapiens TaxID=9606 RepID=L0R816_HUMAN|nr:alternative protein ANKRD62 [Homo sapiens]